MRVIVLAAVLMAASCDGSSGCASKPDPREDPGTGAMCGDTPRATATPSPSPHPRYMQPVDPPATARAEATPKPVPTYDDAYIESCENLGEDCSAASFCHFDEGEAVGRLYDGSAREQREHLDQHPRDYPARSSDEDCEEFR